MKPEAKPLWFKDLPLDLALHRFTVGAEPFTDLALLPWDALGSAAHALTLAKDGFLSTADVQQLVKALESLHREAFEGRLVITPEMEDGHTALELALVARCGEAGKRIHLGRSRNDQVILALRLWMREQAVGLGTQVLALGQAFLALAEGHTQVSMPGYTHLRKAMPSTWGLWAGAFAEGLLEEAEALQGLLQRLDRCPAGAAAGFGAPLPLDRAHLASLLGFTLVQRNPIDVMNSRGRHEGALADWLASVAALLEKALWDLALFSTEEFGLVRLPDAFTTGSSIMPQKRNPDVLELARASCRQLRGEAALLHDISGGLPSSYHRDLQLLKAPLLRLVGEATDLFAVLPALLAGLEIQVGACAAACGEELHAAHAATALALTGAPFRDAYREVASQILSGDFVRNPGAWEALLQVDLATPRRLLAAQETRLQELRNGWHRAYAALWNDSSHASNPAQEFP